MRQKGCSYDSNRWTVLWASLGLYTRAVYDNFGAGGQGCQMTQNDVSYDTRLPRILVSGIVRIVLTRIIWFIWDSLIIPFYGGT